MRYRVATCGAALWRQIWSDGLNPYDGCRASEVRAKYVNGERPPRPPKCDEAIWTLMASCWRQLPRDRPFFDQIVRKLQALMHRHGLEDTSSAGTLSTASTCDVSYHDAVDMP